MKHVCIIGAGAAALLLLYNLEKQNIDPRRITIVDPQHNGGDIQKKWYKVRSNTTWQQIIDAVPSPNSSLQPWCDFNRNEPVELHYIIEYLQLCLRDYMSKTHLRTDTVSQAIQENGVWKVYLAHGKQPLQADVVFFCQGSEPKSLDLPFPSIPLEVALDQRRLSDYVKPGQHVLVFGTAHSGPLVVKNLIDCHAKVTNFYATEKPFYFARDGEYDGIKQDAEVIADAMLNNHYAQCSLESIHDISAVMRATKSTNFCVYACGFEPRVIQSEWKAYNGETGRIEGTSTAWGFGIAYPNKAPDGIHWDVSVPSFQAHIQKQMPDILASLQ